MKVQERQEQLSVLLEAMDTTNSTHDQQKQAVVSSASEVCNLLADKLALQAKVKQLSSQTAQATSELQRVRQERDELYKTAQTLQAQEHDLKSKIDSLVKLQHS